MNNHYQNFLVNANVLADRIDQHADELIRQLGKHETYDAARDEIERSIAALRGTEAELYNISSAIDDLSICTFFPLNLPLYSLILFAIIPGAFAEKVYVRAPEIMQEIMLTVSSILNIKELFSNIKIKKIGRTAFLDLYAKTCDVILFTGRYENARIIQEACPQALFIFNGGGVNPAIVYEDADLTLAANKIFEMRTFNSGQDCAGTDAIFVHRSVVDDLVRYISQLADQVAIGTYGDPTTQIGPILKKEYVESIINYLEAEGQHTVRLGHVNKEELIVHPSIIVKNCTQHTGGFHEFFAPVFYILVFDTEDEVREHLRTEIISDYSMYITYFSKQDHLEDVTFAKLLKNYIINDVEQGNYEYGGYGKKANFVAFGNKSIARPILISREIDNFYTQEALS